MDIVQFVADALGDASYLVISGRTAAVVDPQRDVRPYVDAAEARGAAIEFVFETHVHNDYVSGGRELAALGAQVVAPADSGLAFPHHAVRDGDQVAVGGARLRAISAPGHTYEHTAYLAIDEEGTVRGAFTGGALLVASAGRSDLLGPDHTEELTRLQWESGRRIAAMLSEQAEILPTHGAGSFCSASSTDMERRAPLAHERERNPVLVSPTYEVFRAIHLSVSMPIPGYYRHMAPINRAGPTIFGTPPVPGPLTSETVTGLAATGVRVVDVRTRPDFVNGHVPGSLLIEDSTSLLAYVGWLLPFNSALALVSYDSSQAERIAVDLFRIGYEDVRGYLPYPEWDAATGGVSRIPVVSLHAVVEALASGSRPVVDVRYRYESRDLPIPGALAFPVEELPALADDVPDEAIIVCESGQRSTMAASFLAAAGKRPATLIEGGATAILERLAGRAAPRG